MKVNHSKWIAGLIVTIGLLLGLPSLDKIYAEVLPGVSIASIEVTVKNPESQPISSAKVVVTSPNLPFPLRIQLDGAGQGKLENLPVASYSIYISAPGYFNDTYIGGQVSGNYQHDVTLEHRNGQVEITNFYMYDPLEYSSLDQIKGTVYWSTYGTFPQDSKINLNFFDNNNTVVGNVYSGISPQANTYSLPAEITIPAGATRIGLELKSESSVLAQVTRPLWKSSLYSPNQVLFKDTNPTGGVIGGVLTWTGSLNESQVIGYRVFYHTK
ncbi:carboxypeptidase-like regulatory domain-containing protein, partial [Paenibacillus sp. TAF58]